MVLEANPAVTSPPGVSATGPPGPPRILIEDWTAASRPTGGPIRSTSTHSWHAHVDDGIGGASRRLCSTQL